MRTLLLGLLLVRVGDDLDTLKKSYEDEKGKPYIERYQTSAKLGALKSEEAASLLVERPLAVGDLVYLPRGVVHRGIGGALVMVITVPGFVPGAEIGVDHHLRAIDERLGLEGDAALPFNAAASKGPVVR